MITSASAAVHADDWTASRKLIEKVYKHVCGHFNASDMKTLLQGNRIPNDTTSKYFDHVTS